MDDPGRGAASAPPAAPFTREEIDAAEPERRPSMRRRWLVGLGIGAVGGMVVGLQGFLNPLVLLSLPFALTAAGSGALVGAGLVWTVALLFLGGVLLSGDGLATLGWASSVVVLAVGLVGTWAVAGRVRASSG